MHELFVFLLPLLIFHARRESGNRNKLKKNSTESIHTARVFSTVSIFDEEVCFDCAHCLIFFYFSFVPTDNGKFISNELSVFECFTRILNVCLYLEVIMIEFSPNVDFNQSK